MVEKQLTKKELMHAKIFYLVVGIGNIIVGNVYLNMPQKIKDVWILGGLFCLVGGVTFILGFLVLQFGKEVKK